jgi:hypothetical protein
MVSHALDGDTVAGSSMASGERGCQTVRKNLVVNKGGGIREDGVFPQ